MNFSYLFLLLLQRLLLLLLLLLRLVLGWENTMAVKDGEAPKSEAFAAAAAGPRMGKHHGSEGRRSPKIAPRKCLT